MEMSNADIVRSYLQADKTAAQIEILADLNGCCKQKIKKILVEENVLENTNTTTTVAPTAAAIVSQAPEKKGVRQCKPVDYDRVQALYDAGRTDKQIIDELNISAATMCTWRKNNNLPPNKLEAAVAPPENETKDMDMGKTEKHHKSIHHERMLELREQGMNAKQIAKDIGVTESFVNWYLELKGYGYYPKTASEPTAIEQQETVSLSVTLKPDDESLNNRRGENIEQFDTVEGKIQTTLDTSGRADVTRLMELTFDLLKTVWERIA